MPPSIRLREGQTIQFMQNKGEHMEQYIISKLALAKAQMEVDLLRATYNLEQKDLIINEKDLRIKQLEEELAKLKGSE